MKKITIIIMLLFIVGCSVKKKIQLMQLDDNRIELFFTHYSEIDVRFHLRKKVRLKNPYFWFAKVKLNYFVDREEMSDEYAYPMEYSKDGQLYKIGLGKDLYKVKIRPLGEREIIYETAVFSIDSISFTGIYKNLGQYISLAKHPLEENGETGEKYENKRVLIYEESFSDFKRKNPELAEFLTKGDTIELEVLSPIKAKYRYDAQW